MPDNYMKGHTAPTGGLPSSSTDSSDKDALRSSLMSIGTDKESVENLLSSSALEKIVIPIYWKDGIVFRIHHSFRLASLPDFLKSFGDEFPDGQARWDGDFEGEEHPAGDDVAIRVYFNYQEDDQGVRRAPKPTALEEESYQKMLNRFSYRDEKPVTAASLVHRS
jgi:hypothetical protein